MPGIHFGPLHGLQRSDPDDQLRQLRPMRSRLSDQRPLGEQQHPGGDAGARRSRQDGRGADRPRRARGPRPDFGLAETVPYVTCGMPFKKLTSKRKIL